VCARVRACTLISSGQIIQEINTMKRLVCQAVRCLAWRWTESEGVRESERSTEREREREREIERERERERERESIYL
jgi:hypothetical protein